ncbi:hypothetical protein IWZ01DRAFT_112357 [Phyllosticta capitalensis]
MRPCRRRRATTASLLGVLAHSASSFVKDARARPPASQPASQPTRVGSPWALQCPMRSSTVVQCPIAIRTGTARGSVAASLTELGGLRVYATSVVSRKQVRSHQSLIVLPSFIIEVGGGIML